MRRNLRKLVEVPTAGRCLLGRCLAQNHSSLSRNCQQLGQYYRTASRPELIGLRMSPDPGLQDSFSKISGTSNYRWKCGASGAEPCCCSFLVLLPAFSRGSPRSSQFICALGLFEAGAGHFLQPKGR